MSSRLNGQGLFVSAITGLQNTYLKLDQEALDGLTLEEITNPSDNINQVNLNQNFVQYLSSNFNDLDKNGDAKISSQEMSGMVQDMAQKGMTYNQLVQMCYQNGQSSSLMNTVLTHFNDIDKNHDGRVTNQEISAYGIESEMEKKKTEYQSFDADSFSVFYSSDTSTDSSSSLLDYKYADSADEDS